MDTRVIHTRFWTDGYITKLSAKEKLLFLFLITTDRIGLTGIYEMPAPYIQVATGLSSQEIKQYKKTFMQDGKILFYKSWIYPVNVNRYQTYSGEKNEIARQRELNRIPEEVRKYFKQYCIDTLSIPYLAVADSPRNKKSEIRNKKSYKRNKKEEILDDEELDEIVKKLK